ncbi:hypothetical protein B7463_g2484, partial [Scytalidium lignicola]
MAWKLSEVPGLRLFRVIDVEDMCLVEISSSCKYLTLSYVWGRGNKYLALTRDNKAQLMTPGALRAPLPKTIRDTLNLVKLLGERYIWIDCLCLIQDDPDDMQGGILNMDIVYEGSVLCIVAASGKDANAGLPGLLPHSRQVRQHIEEVTPGVKMMRVDHFYTDLIGSPYVERGWTFQEFMISPRCLVFLDSRVYYRCCHVVWGEDTVYDDFPEETHGNVGTSHILPIFRQSTVSPCTLYTASISRFNGRQLSKESDTLNAMTGVLNRIVQETGGSHYFGLLTLYFDLSLLFYHEYGGDGRRQDFPSWSWVGWKGGPRHVEPSLLGDIDINELFSQDWGDNQIAQEWLAQKTHIIWYTRCLQTGELSLVCHSRAITTDADQTLEANSQDDDDVLRRDLPTIPTQHILSPDIPHDPGYGRDMTRHYEVALLSKADRCAYLWSMEMGIADQPLYWVMLLEWQGPYAERKGLGFIYQAQLEILLA